MSRFANSAFALAIFFGASSAAHAFLTCDPTVSNPPFPPLNPNPTYPSDPAIPFSGSHTKWTADELEINLSIDAAAPTQFHINGMNYEPTQIGGSADFSPFNDFFYTNDVSTWNPLWPRDIPLLRAMGVNAIRTYGMWKWEPGFAQAVTQPNADGVAQFWSQMNFQASKATENNNQFCFPAATPASTRFSTRRTPTSSTFFGTTVSIRSMSGSACRCRSNSSIRTCRKRARRASYARLISGNSTATLPSGWRRNTAITPRSWGLWSATSWTRLPRRRLRIFGRRINDIGAVIKASAPDKLTAFTFHDTPDYNRTITDAPFMNLRGPQVYGLDVYGFNPYTNPLPPGNLFDRFRDERCPELHAKRDKQSLREAADVWGIRHAGGYA